MAAFDTAEKDGLFVEIAHPAFSNKNIAVKILEQIKEFRKEMQEMTQKMMRIEQRQNDGEEKLEKLALNIYSRMDEAEADLKEETNRLENVVSDLQKRIVTSESSSAAAESVSSSAAAEDVKYREPMLRLKSEFENQLKANKMDVQKEMEIFERAMNENGLAQERKWVETKTEIIQILNREKENREKMTSVVDKNASQIIVLNAQIESLSRDLQNQILQPLSKFHERFETMNTSLNEMQKTMNRMKMEKKDDQEARAEMENRFDGLLMTIQELTNEVSVLKKKLNANESNMIEEVQSPAQKVFNSFIKPKNHHLRIIGEYYKVKPDFTWTVNGVKRLESGSQMELLSQVFPLRGYPFGAQAKITLYANSFQFYLSYKDIKKTKKHIRVQPIPNIYVTLKDQSRSQDNRDVIGTHYFIYYKEKLDYDTFYPVYLRNVCRRTLNSSIYNVDDEVVLNIHVEAPEVAQWVYAYDGTLTWAIDDYTKRKQLALDSLIMSYLSPYFYTHANGYRVRVRVYFNGYDGFENKGLTVAVALLTGVYDYLLDENFPHKTTITVFDPTQPERNISKSVEKDSRNCYFVDMGTHEEVEKLLYCDTLYYKVEVEAHEHLSR